MKYTIGDLIIYNDDGDSEKIDEPTPCAEAKSSDCEEALGKAVKGHNASKKGKYIAIASAIIIIVIAIIIGVNMAGQSKSKSENLLQTSEENAVLNKAEAAVEETLIPGGTEGGHEFSSLEITKQELHEESSSTYVTATVKGTVSFTTKKSDSWKNKTFKQGTHYIVDFVAEIDVKNPNLTGEKYPSNKASYILSDLRKTKITEK